MGRGESIGTYWAVARPNSIESKSAWENYGIAAAATFWRGQLDVPSAPLNAGFKPLVVVAGVTAVVDIRNTPDTVLAGALLPRLRIRSRDRFGNPTDDVPLVGFVGLAFERTGTAADTVRGTLRLTRMGVGDFLSDTLRLPVAGNYRLTAVGQPAPTAPTALTVTGETEFIVQARGDAQALVTGFVSELPAGTPVPSFSITFRDAQGNPTDVGIGATSLVRTAGASSTATLSLERLSAGHYRFTGTPSVVLTTTGTYRLAVVGLRDSAIIGSDRVSIVPLQARTAMLLGLRGVLASGQQQPAVQVRYRDRFGNATDYDGTLGYTNADSTDIRGTIALSRPASRAVGVSVATQTRFTVEGAYRLRIVPTHVVPTHGSPADAPSLEGISSFVVLPNVDYSLEVQGLPQRQTVDTELPPLLLLFRDRNGNLTDSTLSPVTIRRAAAQQEVLDTLRVTRLDTGIYRSAPLLAAERPWLRRAEAYQVRSAGIAQSNTLGGRFTLLGAAAHRVEFRAVPDTLNAGTLFPAVQAHFSDRFGNPTQHDTRLSPLWFANSTHAAVSGSGIRSSSGTVEMLGTATLGVSTATRQHALWFAGRYTMGIQGLNATSGTATFVVKERGVRSAQFDGVTPTLAVGDAQSAFTVAFRDQYGNATDHSGAVLFKTTTNTVMGSITTTRTALGVVQATPTAFATPGEYVLSVAGIAAGNTMGNKTFRVVTDSSVQEPCAAHLALRRAVQTFPELAALQNQLISYTKDAQRYGVVSSTSVKIPVIIHLLYSDSAQTQDLTDAQIRSQISVLNADLQRRNADAANTPTRFAGDAGGISELEFCLVSHDSTGRRLPQIGIERKLISQDHMNRIRMALENDGRIINGVFFDGLLAADSLIKIPANGGLSGWHPSYYFNIWIVRSLNNQGNGIYGYASFPSYVSYPPFRWRDGVVIDGRLFGTINKPYPSYRLGRGMTHEVGHWLGLAHIWGDDTCATDIIDDTPTQRWKNFGCPGLNFPVYFWRDPVNGQSIPCDPTNTRGDMYMNYMDYTSDQCKNMFSRGQATVMRSMFAPNGARKEMLLLPSFVQMECNRVTSIRLPSLAVSPNPASNELNIVYELPEESVVTVEVYDLITMRRLIVPVDVVRQQSGLQTIATSSTMLVNGSYTVRMIAYGMSGQVYESTGQAIIVR